MKRRILKDVEYDIFFSDEKVEISQDQLKGKISAQYSIKQQPSRTGWQVMEFDTIVKLVVPRQGSCMEKDRPR